MLRSTGVDDGTRGRPFLYVTQYRSATQKKSSYTEFTINDGDKHLCTKRFSDFVKLHAIIMDSYPNCGLPKLPRKWPFNLTEKMLEERRKGLDTWLREACKHSHITDFRPFQDFFSGTIGSSSSESDKDALVTWPVVLPDQSAVTITLPQSALAKDVYHRVMLDAGASSETTQIFALFVNMNADSEGNHPAPVGTDDGGVRPKQRKLEDDEVPYVFFDEWQQKHPLSAGSVIVVARWLFTPLQEALVVDPFAINLIYKGAVRRYTRGEIPVTPSQKRVLDRFKTSDPEMFIRLIRRLPQYMHVLFTHCTTNYRTPDERIDVTVGIKGLTLINRASWKKKRFLWSNVTRWKVHDQRKLFAFEGYDDGCPLQIHIQCAEYEYLNACVVRVITELMWTKQVESNRSQNEVQDALPPAGSFKSARAGSGDDTSADTISAENDHIFEEDDGEIQLRSLV